MDDFNENQDLIEEVQFDYQITNDGRTHILVVDFPEGCDEESFLIILKAYYRAQSENISRIQSGLSYHN